MTWGIDRPDGLSIAPSSRSYRPSSNGHSARRGYGLDGAVKHPACAGAILIKSNSAN